MRPLSFDPQALRKHLLRHKIATLPELRSALGTTTNLTVFRKLKLLDYLSSYTHRGRYYALRETVGKEQTRQLQENGPEPSPASSRRLKRFRRLP